MKEIALTKGLAAIVDDEDYEEMSKHKWHYEGRTARRRLSVSEGGLNLQMHVQLMGTIRGLEVDHINGNPLDNRRENLRHVTHAQNQYNRKPNKEGASQYKGVNWIRRGKPWRALIRTNGKLIHIGYYKSEAEAATAYNEAAIKHFGEYARLNTI